MYLHKILRQIQLFAVASFSKAPYFISFRSSCAQAISLIARFGLLFANRFISLAVCSSGFPRWRRDSDRDEPGHSPLGKALHWSPITFCALTVTIFAVLSVISSPYPGRDNGTRETAVMGAAIHIFEWDFVRPATFAPLAGVVGVILTRKHRMYGFSAAAAPKIPPPGCHPSGCGGTERTPAG